ncbi:Uncharacterised protein [Mycobacteroides abscessus subsp. abscessus]|nr:Uncharacterised protein [Mycobacteroides abscessus]SHR01710.1 Uncharacterised protein [Mycobacteroides abscessus subsp. abscessus]SKV85377.1 Uncharacterised protein [Mycobacteroides abscessus subsp. massiliense]SHT16985.1 Uncharacterised protein [Mycobacteroides abscessus subsp. abscessus]SIK11905.1 Uncharacterised protein [Mycobacteroides abscessus subsp. abscessus]
MRSGTRAFSRLSSSRGDVVLSASDTFSRAAIVDGSFGLAVTMALNSVRIACSRAPELSSLFPRPWVASPNTPIKPTGGSPRCRSVAANT